MSFAGQLKKRREDLGLSRIDLSERLSISPSAVSNYENGTSFPREDILLRLFDALDVDPNTLFSGSFRSAFPDLSSAEQELVRDCRTLPPTARRAVHELARTLCACRDELAAERAAEDEPRFLPVYCSPAAAGYASPVCGSDFDYVPADDAVPRGAEYGVRIQGDSMAPHIADGSVVYVNHDPLVNGDVGIFCVDGDMLCKQYCRDPMGITYLFSLNRRRADADVVFGASSGRSLVCMGRVITPRRFPLPGR